MIHSMSEFADIILPCLAAAQACNVVEIGAEYGGMSKMLGDFVTAAGGVLTSIDPKPKDEFVAWSRDFPASWHIAGYSLDTIPTLTGNDAWIVDGDHNYYTVANELRAIEAVTRLDAKPLLVFLHDVGWPWARRDLYYAPDRIPAEHRHRFDYESGTVLDDDALVHGRGFRGHGSFAIATHAGGPRNGILTAVEDFIAAGTNGRSLAFARVPAVFGLGVLFDIDAPWSETLASIVMPYHENRLLAALENNRLRNYLKVIDLQDSAC